MEALELLERCESLYLLGQLPLANHVTVLEFVVQQRSHSELVHSLDLVAGSGICQRKPVLSSTRGCGHYRCDMYG